jgi:AraC-like DNA-binding protein
VMHYVARWRMQVAVTWLKDEDVPVGEIARRPGYESEAAFRRAFKRFLVFPPGAVRRAAGRSMSVHASGAH